MASSEPQQLEGTPCASGDRCNQSWTIVDPDCKCSRCSLSLHHSCAAIDATKAPKDKVENPDAIRICFTCLRPGETPNQVGITASSKGGGEPPSKRARTGDTDNKDDDDDDGAVVPMEDINWVEMVKPHPSLQDLVNQNKIVAPQASKKTIWWRCFHTWNMEDFASEVEQPFAYCNLCGKAIKMSKVDRSPTPLRRHLEIHHKNLFKTMYVQKLKDGPVVAQPSGEPGSRDRTTAKKGKRDLVRQKQLKAIVKVSCIIIPWHNNIL